MKFVSEIMKQVAGLQADRDNFRAQIEKSVASQEYCGSDLETWGQKLTGVENKLCELVTLRVAEPGEKVVPNEEAEKHG